MKLSKKQLLLPAAKGSRLVVLSLLDEASESAGRLAASTADDNLHRFRVDVRRLRIWLMAFRDDFDEVRKSDLRRLKKCVKATNSGRDLEVHMAWLAKEGIRKNLRRQRGAMWLHKELGNRRGAPEDAVNVAIEKYFKRVRNSLSSRLATDTQSSDSNGNDAVSLGGTIGARLTPLSEKLARDLDRIAGMADEDGCHAARIHAKRIRYLLEPAVPRLKGAVPVMTRLRRLQDSLGALHDLQLLARIMQQVLEASAVSTSRRKMQSVLGDMTTLESERRSRSKSQEILLPEDGSVGPADILAVAKRLRLDAKRNYESVQRKWLDGKHHEFNDQLEAIATQLMLME